MAKSNEFSLKSWDDADRALRTIAECEISQSEIEAQLNISVNEAKERAARLAKPLKTQSDSLKALVKAFVEENRADMEGKSRRLNFGSVGFRQTSSVSVPTKKIMQIIQNLRKFGMEKCIITKETVDKEALEKYSDEDIAKVGASRKVEDRFWMETDKEKVRG